MKSNNESCMNSGARRANRGKPPRVPLLRGRGILQLVVVSLALLSLTSKELRADVVWQESFEGSTGGWAIQGSANVWQIGVPTYGPAAHSGTNCAGTILNGPYPYNVNAMLISPQIAVPSAGQQPFLRFWSWHSMGSANHYGQVMISTNGVAWTNLTERLVDGTGGAWMQRIVDLTAYGGQTVQIAFQFVADSSCCNGEIGRAH